jgi:hypothetical protein
MKRGDRNQERWDGWHIWAHDTWERNTKL